MIGRGDGFKEKDPAVAAGKDRQGEKLGRASEGEGEGVMQAVVVDVGEGAVA